MLRIREIKLPIPHNAENLERKIRKILRYQGKMHYTIVRKSLDARKKTHLQEVYLVDVLVDKESEVYSRCQKEYVRQIVPLEYHFPVCDYHGQERPVIIGMGPAGLFCGYMLAKAGFRPILLERGKCVEERKEDVSNFWKTGKLEPESNVQFGEGGAGTFSDGKLNTLVKEKYGRNREVLRIFVEHGAPEEILYDYKPHIGTDILEKVVRNLREDILRMGGEVRFQTKITGMKTEKGRLTALILNDSEVLKTNYAVLAIGHSARDTFEMLLQEKVPMEAKPFAVGMRVEHPQKWINFVQYGTQDAGSLGSAVYKVTAKSKEGRGVYSFCMCPGGYVVNASSQQGLLAVNGMSYSGRNSSNANSAVIVTVTPEDYGGAGDPLSGMRFQQKLEKKAYEIGNGKIPVERYGDYRKTLCPSFLEKTKQEEAQETIEGCFENFEPCIKGQWEYAKVHEILPHHLAMAFFEGMEQIGEKFPMFNHSRVLLEGIESRTSSPVRILRDEQLQSLVKGLYPCGEGAGYAGGITSAAMDGIFVAETIAKKIQERI